MAEPSPVQLVAIERDPPPGHGVERVIVNVVAVRVGKQGRGDVIPVRATLSSRSASRRGPIPRSIRRPRPPRPDQGRVPPRTRSRARQTARPSCRSRFILGQRSGLDPIPFRVPISDSVREMNDRGKASLVDETEPHPFPKNPERISTQVDGPCVPFSVRPVPSEGVGRREERVSLIFPSTHPVVHTKLAALRATATRPAEFRGLVRSLAMLLAHEATADLAIRPSSDDPARPGSGRVLAGTIGDRADPPRRPGDGRRAPRPPPRGRGLAHRPLPRRADAPADRVLQQAPRPVPGHARPGGRPDAGDRRVGRADLRGPQVGRRPPAQVPRPDRRPRRDRPAAPRRCPTSPSTSAPSTTTSTTSASFIPGSATRATGSSART